MEERKVEILRAMFEVAYADGNFDPYEKVAMANILGYLGYTPDEVRSIGATSSAGDLARLDQVLADREERLEALGDLITVALADGLITNEELDYLKAMAARLGFSEEEFTDQKMAVFKGLQEP